MVREVESRHSSVYRISDEERAAVRAGIEAMRREDFASEEEIDDFYRLRSGARA
jgi:hypothetical protein